MKKSALSRKPRRNEDQDADVLAVIEKGGSSAAGERAKKMKDRAMNLRIPGQLAELIDEAINQRVVRVSKNTWILEAIAEKAARELETDR
jgi:hypothetical protein